MIVTQRPFCGELDKRQMAALVHRTPEDNVHVVDLPYRLSSGALDDPENVGLWVGGGGRLVAWTILQPGFWTVDFAYDPEDGQELLPEMLAWADWRARAVKGTPSERSQWYVKVFSDQADRIRILEEAGFACQADVGEDSWSEVFMARPGESPVEEPALPAGFTIRPLGGEKEVEAYVELHRDVFETKNMTVEWRSHTLQRPEYVPELDLVVAAPDGRLVAFCIFWLDRDPVRAVSGQIEPLGVRAEFRGLGLARAVLAEGLRRLQQHRAKQVYVMTDSFRDAALGTYRAVGFEVVRDIWVFRKD